jgi:Arc/MetJ-type ribon-helix-helix transcriptional regulator
MARKRAHIVLPDDLLADIDALVGPRGRSAFLTEVIRDAVNRRRLLKFLNSDEPILKEDYPEFRDGAEAWVRKMRDQDLQIEREKLGDWLNRATPNE